MTPALAVNRRIILRKAVHSHDVSGEPRDTHGKWVNRAHLAGIDAKIARAEKRHAALSGTEDRDTELTAHTGYDVGGIRTPDGRKSALRRLDATIDHSVEMVRLQRELAYLRSHREAYVAGKVNEQGYPTERDGDKLRRLVATGAELLKTGRLSSGKVLSAEERASLKEIVAGYRRKLKQAKLESAAGELGKAAIGEPQRLGCVMLHLDEDCADLCRNWAARNIPDADLAAKGCETKPHITVRYGLHALDAAPVEEVLRHFGPLGVDVAGITIFSSPEHDVVKMAVDSESLRAMHTLLGTLPHTDTHSDYQPHITLAYVKPGLGAKYVAPGPLTGSTLAFTAVAYSNPEKVSSTIRIMNCDTGRARRILLKSATATTRQAASSPKRSTPAELDRRITLEMARCQAQYDQAQGELSEQHDAMTAEERGLLRKIEALRPHVDSLVNGDGKLTPDVAQAAERFMALNGRLARVRQAGQLAAPETRPD